MKTLIAGSNRMANVVPARDGGVRDWQRWVPFAAVAWSLIYAVLAVYWAVSGRGFPYTTETMSDVMGPLLGRFGQGVAWIVVMMAGIPAVAVGAAMLHGVRSRALRPLFITAGALLAGVLLLLMTDLNLLITLGYTPLGIVKLFTGDEFGQVYLGMLTQWTTIHQLLCLIGGFLWLAATVCYGRWSGGACLYCGRRDIPEGWQSPERAARWGRIAVYVAMAAPVFYALTRYAWALRISLGMSEEHLGRYQESGNWVSGLFLATFGLVGAVLMLGLVQRWGEVFPRWMIGLAGRRVPIALAVVPASLVSVLLIVGGIGIWAGLGQMVANLAASGAEYLEVIGAIIFQVGPTLLFPVWGLALAVATLGYYYRRRSPCSVCGRGAPGEIGKPSSTFKNVKAGTLLILLLSIVLASCARPQPDPPKEVSILWSEIEQSVGLEVGDILEVVLPANPSTGYIWEAGFYNQSVLKPYGEPEFSNTSTKLGAEESQKLHFEAIGEGETELVLAYRRSFENEEVDQQTFQVQVVVK